MMVSSIIIPDDDAEDYPDFSTSSRSSRGLPDLPAIATRQSRPQWVAWKYVQQPGEAKPKKMPVNPATGAVARVNDPATWGSYEAAAARAQRENLAGVGYVMTADDGLCGFDIDDLYDQDVRPLVHDRW